MVKHSPNATPSLHTLHLDTGYWDEVSVDGKKYFAVAGIRAKHEDSCMVVPYFLPVENKSGLTVTKAEFQLIDQINICKQVQSFRGAQILQILSDKGTELVYQEFETAARQRGIHLATSPAHQPQSNSLAERLWD